MLYKQQNESAVSESADSYVAFVKTAWLSTPLTSLIFCESVF